MSSPIAKREKTGVDRLLIAAHHQLSHERRVAVLAHEIAMRIAGIVPNEPGKNVSILDVGCGDMSLVDAVAAKLGGAQVRCADIHRCPAPLAQADPRWRRYVQFDGKTLPFDEGAFDVVLLSDVLHHVPESQRGELLASAGRVGRHILIKDHFEYGWWSRQILRLMDWVGNFGYGVSVPQRYFDVDGFRRLCERAGLEVTGLDVGIQLYDALPVARSLLSPDWQFFAHCRVANRPALAPRSSDLVSP
ncbi:MAG: class I SAM-dependent methyltransferase [Burkholderiales bacterium]|nr:class I SAM-dependent methyltransferase [Burkholderiales bacterium]